MEKVYVVYQWAEELSPWSWLTIGVIAIIAIAIYKIRSRVPKGQSPICPCCQEGEHLGERQKTVMDILIHSEATLRRWCLKCGGHSFLYRVIKTKEKPYRFNLGFKPVTGSATGTYTKELRSFYEKMGQPLPGDELEISK